MESHRRYRTTTHIVIGDIVHEKGDEVEAGQLGVFVSSFLRLGFVEPVTQEHAPARKAGIKHGDNARSDSSAY